MLTNTSNKKTISNLLEELIEDYVHSNEMYDWCIEDDESYTVYNLKNDKGSRNWSRCIRWGY